jgi:minor extracellular serine protease Vpr
VFLEDSAFSHDIIEAVEDSVADGMDVINLSIGGGVQGPHDALADAINSAVDAGVVAAVAAGNSGPGIFTVESPGSALNALTAGAITNPHFIGVPVINGSSTFGAVIGQFGALTAFTATAYVVTAPVNGCGAGLTNAAAVSGKIALIQRGVCTFSEKIRNAQTAGALAVIVSQNRLGDPIVMGQDGTPNQPTIPGVMVNRASGTALAAAAVKTVDVGTTEQEFLTAADGSGDLLADFSSHGPAPFTYLIKPDVTAPGVNVYSSVFDENDFSVKTFELFQGTSMATPHLSGTAVLLRQLHPDWSAFDIKSIIVNAAPNPVKDAFIAADPVQRFLARGNGRVDVVNANASPLSFNPVSASFGFFNGNVPVQSSLNVTVTNLTSTAQSCTTAKSVTLSLGLNLAGVPAPSTSILSVPASIGLAAGASQTVTFGLNAGQSTSIASGFYGGDVTLTCGSTTLRVPWFFLVSREGKP